MYLYMKSTTWFLLALTWLLYASLCCGDQVTEKEELGSKFREASHPEVSVIPVEGEGLDVSGKYNEEDEIHHQQQQQQQLQQQQQQQQQQQPLPRGHLKKLGEQSDLILDGIQVLDYMIGGQDFYKYFLRQHEPVFFKGVTKDWKATQQWKNETYLLEKYPDVLFDVEMGKVYEQSQHPRKTMAMKEFLERYKVETKMYLDSPFPQSPLMLDMEVPLMMQCDKLYTRFTSAHMLFSNGNSSSPLHYDGYENFLTSMSGIKVVYTASPKFADDIYIDNYIDFPGLSPINPERVDLLKYPRFSNVRWHKVVIEPGDILYIPQGWFHQVRSYQSPNIGVSMWFHYYDLQDVLGENSTSILRKLKEEVERSPESIACEHQVLNMSSMKDLVLTNIGDKAAEVPQTDGFVNNTVLYETVSPTDAMLYVGSDDHWIYAVEITTGKIKWKVETREDTGSGCAFNLDATMVYCGADDSYMRAMQVETGTVVWKYGTEDRVISSALVDDQGVIYFGSLDQEMYALFPNGTLKWKTKLNGSIWSSPTTNSDGKVIFIATDEKTLSSSNVFALQSDDGKIIWKKFSSHSFKSSPVYNALRGELYLCDNGGNVYVLDPVTGNVKLRIDIEDEMGIWSTPTFKADGTLYAASHSGKLIAYNLDSEENKWTLDLGSSERGTNSSPLISKAGLLYIGGGNGTVFAIQSSTGEVVWRRDIGTSVFYSSPRLSTNGLLYIGCADGPLYALDARTGNVHWKVDTDGPLVGTPLITREFKEV